MNKSTPEPESQSIKSKKFSLQDNNKKAYELIISLKKEQIELSVREIDDISGTSYKNNYSHEQLSKNKIFKLNDNITEDFEEVFDKFEASDISISLENKSLSVSFKCLILKKTEIINYVLLPQKIQIEDVVYNLCQKSNEVDALKKEVKELKKENEDLKKKIEFLFGTSFDFNLEEFNGLFNEIKKNSRIIGCAKDLELIFGGIKKTVNKKINKISFLMKASVDGDSSSVFHQKCDNKPFTLVLVITEKNRRFGGFTSIPWDQSSSYKIDDKSFIFSLDNHEIYYPKNPNSQSAIYCHSSYGPTFGNGNDFYIASQCRSNNSSYDNTGQYHYNTQGRKSVLAIDYNFKVFDFEVYNLEFA